MSRGNNCCKLELYKQFEFNCLSSVYFLNLVLTVRLNKQTKNKKNKFINSQLIEGRIIKNQLVMCTKNRILL